MSRISASKLTAYTKDYVESVFAYRLREEGFINPDGKNICWYRIVNKEVVNMICFFSRWSAEPIILEVGYGIHPLFIEPFQSSKVYMHSNPCNQEILADQFLIGENETKCMEPYSSDIPIMVPCSKDKGLYTLEEIILPKMNATRTIQDCYRLHKDRYVHNARYPLEQMINACSIDFIDEGLYFEDTELYPLFQKIISQWLQVAEQYDAKRLSNPTVKEWLLRMKYQQAVLSEGKRIDFLKNLDQRKGRIIATIEKKMNISI